MQPLIFPLNLISQTDVALLQVALRPSPLLQPAFMQQRPRSINALLAQKKPVNLPWDANGMPGLIDMSIAKQSVKPNVVHELLPKQATDFMIMGFTKDSTGTLLPACVVHLFRTSDDALMKNTTSDAAGFYMFSGAGISMASSYYVVAYKAGSPDVAGTTVKTLTGS